MIETIKYSMAPTGSTVPIAVNCRPTDLETGNRVRIPPTNKDWK